MLAVAATYLAMFVFPTPIPVAEVLLPLSGLLGFVAGALLSFRRRRRS